MTVFNNFGAWVVRHLRKNREAHTASATPQFDPSPIWVDRPLSPEERRLLEWLIEHGTPEARDLRSQVEQARVVSHCRCGCPTVDLGITGMERTSGGSQILADFIGQTPEGFRVGVLLHAREGRLSELEVYNLSEKEGAFSLPFIETLEPWAK